MEFNTARFGAAPSDVKYPAIPHIKEI